MNDKEPIRETRHGKHVRIACEFCPDHKIILRFRHVAHVKKFHAEHFRAFWKASGKWYPKIKREGEHHGEHVGEHVGEHGGEHVVNMGEHVVNIGEQMVNIKNFEIGEHGEHVVNMVNIKNLVNIGEHGGEHMVNIGEHRGEHLGEHVVNIGEHHGEHLYSLKKLDILKMLTKEELAEELYLRVMRGEIEGGGLDGVKVDGGKLQLLFIPNIKEQWLKKTTNML